MPPFSFNNLPEMMATTYSADRQAFSQRASVGVRAACLLMRCGLILAGLLVLAASAAAQTTIPGAIAVDSRWTVAGSPYLINGDVVVQNGAVLTIDAGVTVFMAANGSLTVQAGGIKAEGTQANPIQVLSDKTRLGQAAAAGDWKQWIFNPGTVNTRLDYVVFEHGSGLIVRGSAPVFNYLDIRNHQGAAVSIDLAASPSGVGNQASGNTVNGIAVPAGDISGSVKWGLRGIPFVVAAGVVSVGASPAVTSITPDVLQQSATTTVNVTGSRLTGLTSARFDKTGLTAQILPGATDTQASLSITADASAVVGATVLHLLTDAGEVRVANALTLVQSQPTLTSLAPSTLYLGLGTVDVTVNGRNFTNQSTVQANGTAVTTQFLSATQLRASIVTPSAAGNLSIRVRTPDPASAGQYLLSNELVLAVAPAQLIVTPSPVSIAKGSVRTFTVTLPYAAASGGVAVNLVSSVPTVATVPATLTVPEGQISAGFPLTAAELGSTVVTASKTGFVSGQAQVTVISPPALTLTPSSVTLGVGRTAELTIQASVAAGPSGLNVGLSSSAPAVATVPASVTVPAGATSATVSVSTVAIGTATITAQAADFVSGSTAVTVRQVSLNLPAGALVAPGLSRSIPITLSDPAPAGGLLITLASNDPAIATVPASVAAPAGQTNANFTLTGIAAGATSISATATGYQSAALPVTVETVTINIGSPRVTSVSVPVDVSQTYAITLSRPAPAGGVVVSLATADATKATVSPSSITIAEGETSGGVVLASVAGVAKGSTTLSVSAAGLNAASVPVTVTGKPELAFSTAAVTVGKGLKTYLYEVYVYRRTDGSSYAPNQALTVNLVSADSAKVSVPTTVTIPAGSAEAYFQVTGVDLTSGAPVTIDATATGYSAAVTKLATNVVAPLFTFSGLDPNRSAASARDDFRVYVTTPGAAYSGNQTAAADLPINLSIVDGTPAGIVDGFYSAATGGTAVTQVILRRDLTYSDIVYVGTPTTAGSYKVQASAAGATTNTSATVTVSAPELRFSTSAVTVGKGLKTYLYEVYVYRAVGGAAFNGSQPLTVNLVSSNAAKASVPVTVTIPAGQSSVYFLVTGVDLTSGTPVTIDATATGYSAAVTKLAATVVAPLFTFSGLDPNRSAASARDDFRVYVTTPGAAYSGNQTAAADLPINLSIVDGTPAGIVDGFYSAATGGTAVTQVILRRDLTYSDIVYVGTPTTAGSYKVQASATGVATSTSAAVTVSAPELRFSTSAVTVGKGLKTYLYEVYVYRAVGGAAFNGSQPLTVNLVSSNAAKASVPATVTIPAGSAEAYFQVTGVDLTSGTPVTIDATATGYSAAVTKLAATVVAPLFTFQGLDPNRSAASARDDFRVYVTVPGAAYSGNQTAAADLPINLSIVDGTPAGIVDGFYSAATGGTAVTQVTLRRDLTYSDIVYVGTPTTAGSYKVQASATGVATGTSATVTVSAPELRFSTSAVTVGKGLKTYLYEVYVYRAVGGAAFNGSEPLTVNLACSSTVICTVAASVTIPAGQSSAYFLVEGVSLGNTTITASAVGYGAIQDLGVNVVTPQLVFSGLSGTTVGGQRNFSVYVTTPGAAYSGNQTAVSAITVNLTSSAPGVATVPATVTIPINGIYSANAALTGVAAGTTTITASGAGLSGVTSGVITITP